MPSSIFHAFGVVCLVFSWLAYDHYRPWVNFHSEALAFLGIGLLVASRFFKRTKPVFFASRPCLWVLAAALLPWLQYVVGISFFAGDALISSFYLAGFAVAIWLGNEHTSNLHTADGALASLFYAIWIAAIALAVIGLLQWLSLQDVLAMYAVQTDTGDRAMGNLGQPNQLATLLLMGLAALAWTFETKRIGAVGLTIGAAFISVVLVLTQSRSGMLGAVVMATYLCWKNYVNPLRISTGFVACWVIAFVACVQLLPVLHELLLMSDPRSMNVAVDTARVVIWKQTLAGIAQAPWFGYGWNQTPTAHAVGGLLVPGSLTFTNAHNVVLDLLAWNGIPLGLMLVGAGSYWLVSRMYSANNLTAIYAIASLLPLTVHSLVEYPFAYSYFLLTAGLMVGVVEALHPRIKTLKFNPRWAGLALSIWASLGFYVVYEYLLIEEDFRIVRFENLNIGQTSAEYKVPNIWMLSHMGAMLREARRPAIANMAAEDIESLRKVALRFAYGSLSVRYALVLGLNGDPVGATKQMAIIKGMYGDSYYRVAVIVLRDMQREKYPQLAQVLTP